LNCELDPLFDGGWQLLNSEHAPLSNLFAEKGHGSTERSKERYS
jgi:hypothetical protein